MNSRTHVVIGRVALAIALAVAAACHSKGDAGPTPGAPNAPVAEPLLVLGASLSLTGSLAREGGLTKEGYELCANVMNDKGEVPVGDEKPNLEVR